MPARSEPEVAEGHVDHLGTWHESTFRVMETYDVTMPPDWCIALDDQPYGEIALVLEGRLVVTLDDVTTTVGPGDLAILLPGSPRVTRAGGGRPLRFTGFGFRMSLHGHVELSGLLQLPVRIARPESSMLELLHEAVRYGATPGPLAALRSRALAELCVAEVVEHAGEVGLTGQSPRPEIAAALELVEQDPAAVLHLEELARAAGLSTAHFARSFRDAVGVPPMAYVMALRLGLARKELATTRRTTARIATDLGFADAAHFSRSFKRAFGCSPSEYRRGALLPQAREQVVSPVQEHVRLVQDDDVRAGALSSSHHQEETCR